MSIGVHGEKIIEDSINGMEYRSGFEFNTPTRFSIASTGNLLLDQIDHIYRWTLSSTLNFGPNQDQAGVMIQVSSIIGDSGSLKSDNMASQYSPYEIGELSGMYPNRIGSEIGYGFDLLDSQISLTPFYRFEMTRTDINQFSVGSRVSFGSNFNVEILVHAILVMKIRINNLI